jgi:hypothetical protein
MFVYNCTRVLRQSTLLLVLIGACLLRAPAVNADTTPLDRLNTALKNSEHLIQTRNERIMDIIIKNGARQLSYYAFLAKERTDDTCILIYDTRELKTQFLDRSCNGDVSEIATREDNPDIVPASPERFQAPYHRALNQLADFVEAVPSKNKPEPRTPQEVRDLLPQTRIDAYTGDTRGFSINFHRMHQYVFRADANGGCFLGIYADKQRRTADDPQCSGTPTRSDFSDAEYRAALGEVYALLAVLVKHFPARGAQYEARAHADHLASEVTSRYADTQPITRAGTRIGTRMRIQFLERRLFVASVFPDGRRGLDGRVCTTGLTRGHGPELLEDLGCDGTLDALVRNREHAAVTNTEQQHYRALLARIARERTPLADLADLQAPRLVALVRDNLKRTEALKHTDDGPFFGVGAGGLTLSVRITADADSCQFTMRRGDNRAGFVDRGCDGSLQLFLKDTKRQAINEEHQDMYENLLRGVAAATGWAAAVYPVAR